MIPLTQKPFEKRLAIHLDCERQAAILFHPAPGTCWRQWNHRVLAMLVWIEILEKYWLETLTFREVQQLRLFFVGETRTWFFFQSWVKPGLVNSQHLISYRKFLRICAFLNISCVSKPFQISRKFQRLLRQLHCGGPLRVMAFLVASGCLKFKVILNGKS